jgi:hypothetical protein
MSMLEQLMAKFQAADTKGHEKVVTNAADTIERTWTGDTGFNRGAMICVCDLSAKIGPFSRISSLFVNTCTAKLNEDLSDPCLKPENGHTMRS